MAPFELIVLLLLLVAVVALLALAPPRVRWAVLGTIAVDRAIELPLVDVNEPPEGIALQRASVKENDPGASLGDLRVLDPDADADYSIEVLDPRFEWRDGQLKLVDGIALDHEAEPAIALTVVATETRAEGFEIAQTITLSVVDANDPPNGILVRGAEVPRQTAGASVGLVDVDDPDGDVYQISVLDERFEIVEGVLKVRDTATVDQSADTQIAIDLVATAGNGDRIVQRVPLVVVPPRSPHQNPQNPLDVNGDGLVTPLDALILINDLNRNPSGELPAGSAGEASPIKPDVNGDGLLSPLDVLIIINDLNNSRGPGGEGEYVAVDQPPVGAFPPIADSSPASLDQVRRDRELELLIEQIAAQDRSR